MKPRFYAILILLISTAPAFATVTVTEPSNGEKVGSLVQFVATATASSCSDGVASIGIYVDNSLKYVKTGNSLNTTISLGSGTYNTIVQEWDNCGGSTTTSRTIEVTDQDGVYLTSPANNSTLSPVVAFTATASANNCPQGVASMGIYVDNALKYTVPGAKLNTQLTLAAGAHKTVAEEWDHCGHSSTAIADVNITSASSEKKFSNMQAIGGWIQWGEMPPSDSVCTSPCSGVTVSMKQHIPSPSLSGNATKYTISGTKDYSDALFSVAPIGQRSSEGLPDPNHTLLPTIHNFIYDAEVDVTNAAVTQSLEFDTNMYLNGQGLEWGTQCAHLGDGDWDIWDNVNTRWVSTGFACPLTDGWHHVSIQVQRESNNVLLYQTITWDGVSHTINKTYPHFSVPSGWYGATVNYQMDGNYKMSANTTYLDQFSLTYW